MAETTSLERRVIRLEERIGQLVGIQKANADKLQNRRIKSTAPGANQSLVWDEVVKAWGPETTAAGIAAHNILDGAVAHMDSATGDPTKGDLIVGSGTLWDDLAVGSNTQVLTADSAQTLGIKWAAVTTDPDIELLALMSFGII